MSEDELSEVAARATLDAVRDRLWPFTALVFSLPGAAGYPRHIGGCTLVASRGGRFVLTAAHVWSAIPGDLFLGFHPPHPPLQIPRDVLIPHMFVPAGHPSDGPDLAFLRLPDVDANLVATEKAFYNLDARGLGTYQGDAYWTVLGAPAERTEYREPRVDMRLTFVGSRRIRTHDSGDFDYVDVLFNRREAEILPQSFRGVSGSGLWQVPVSPNRPGEAYSVGDPILSGVAFYEEFDDSARTTGFIRGHGLRSLYAQRP